MNAPLPIGFRGIETEEDRNFILHFWRTSFRESHFGYTLTSEAYFQIQKEKMLAALEMGRALLAHLEDDDDLLIGFIVFAENPYEKTVIHYTFVKPEFRGMGVGQSLIQEARALSAPNQEPVVCIDVTKDFFELREEHSLPLVTAREWEKFVNKNPEDPTTPFQSWFRTRTYKKKQNRQQTRIINSELKRQSMKDQNE